MPGNSHVTISHPLASEAMRSFYAGSAIPPEERAAQYEQSRQAYENICGQQAGGHFAESLYISLKGKSFTDGTPSSILGTALNNGGGCLPSSPGRTRFEFAKSYGLWAVKMRGSAEYRISFEENQLMAADVVPDLDKYPAPYPLSFLNNVIAGAKKVESAILGQQLDKSQTEMFLYLIYNLGNKFKNWAGYLALSTVTQDQAGQLSFGTLFGVQYPEGANLMRWTLDTFRDRMMLGIEDRVEHTGNATDRNYYVRLLAAARRPNITVDELAMLALAKRRIMERTLWFAEIDREKWLQDQGLVSKDAEHRQETETILQLLENREQIARVARILNDAQKADVVSNFGTLVPILIGAHVAAADSVATDIGSFTPEEPAGPGGNTDTPPTAPDESAGTSAPPTSRALSAPASTVTGLIEETGEVSGFHSQTEGALILAGAHLSVRRPAHTLIANARRTFQTRATRPVVAAPAVRPAQTVVH